MTLISICATILQHQPIPGPIQKVLDFIDTPLPYSPFSEYFIVLGILWFLARREDNRNTFDAEAQAVLDDKLAAGEIDHKTYDKYRQETSLRPKR